MPADSVWQSHPHFATEAAHASERVGRNHGRLGKSPGCSAAAIPSTSRNTAWVAWRKLDVTGCARRSRFVMGGFL
jgi:hypothetical protein